MPEGLGSCPFSCMRSLSDGEGLSSGLSGEVSDPENSRNSGVGCGSRKRVDVPDTHLLGKIETLANINIAILRLSISSVCQIYRSCG